MSSIYKKLIENYYLYKINKNFLYSHKENNLFIFKYKKYSSDVPTVNTEIKNINTLFTYTIINKLRKYLPNFINITGIYSDNNILTINNDYQIIKEHYNTNYTLEDYIKSVNFNEHVFYNILIQVLLALYVAHVKYNFKHNSLHPKNIILTSNNKNISLNILNSNITVIPDTFIPVIDNFDTSTLCYKGIDMLNIKHNNQSDLSYLILECISLLNSNNINTQVLKTIFSADIDNTQQNALHNSDNLLIHINTLQTLLNNKCVYIKDRTIIKHTQPNTINIKDIDSVNIGILKKYLYSLKNINYNITEDEKINDELIIKMYKNHISFNIPILYTFNINFPITTMYSNNENVKMNFSELYNKQIFNYKIISNYLELLSCMELDKNNLEEYKTLFQYCNIYKINIYNMNKIIIHKFFKLVSSDNIDCILYKEIPDILKLLSCIIKDDNIMNYTYNNSVSVYYPTHTLKQIEIYYNYNPTLLSQLISKIFFGKSIDKTELIHNNLSQSIKKSYNDIEIYNNLRQFYTPNSYEHRVPARISELKNIFRHVKELYNFIPNSYLDFGGGNGSISSAITTYFNIQRDNAYSADVDEWCDRKHSKTFDNIIYLTLKQGKQIPLPDNSIDFITCYQVLHHIENHEFIIKELSRICKHILILREHNCEHEHDKILIDIEHSVFELCTQTSININYLDSYEAWYNSKHYWSQLFNKYNFIELDYKNIKSTPTKYYYSVFKKNT